MTALPVQREEEQPTLEVTAGTTIASTSVNRFVATVTAAGCMAVTGVATARALGPAGKGAVSTLSYLTALLAAVAALGLGDAAIVLHGSRERPVRDSARSVIAGTVLASAVAGGVLVLLAHFTSLSTVPLLPAVLLAALTIAPTALTINLMRLNEAVGRITFSSVAYLVFASATTVLTLLFVSVAGWGVEGALVALLLGPSVSTALLWRSLARRALLRPRPPTSTDSDRATQRRRLGRLAVPLMGSSVLRSLTRRVDLLIVAVMAGRSTAGLYTVALSASELVLYAPAAMAAVTFPRLAKLRDETEVAGLVAELCRSTAVAVVAVAIPAAIAVPFAVPALFGRGFEGAVGPTELLFLSTLLLGLQWAMARAAAARGDTRPLVRSFLGSTTAMVLLDVALVPAFGAMGAALAAGVGPLAGCAICMLQLRAGAIRVTPRSVLPTPADARRLIVRLAHERRRRLDEFARRRSHLVIELRE